MSQIKDTFDKFFGRRKGHSLSRRQKVLVDELLPRIAVDVDGIEAGTLDPLSLFDGNVKEVWLEVGFGKGEHLASLAEQNPDIGFIGCEPFINGVAGLLTLVEDMGLKNVRIYADDARHVMDALTDGSISRGFLLHPDPWPKRKHARRRFMSQVNLDRFSRLLKPGSEFRMGSDHDIYVRWTLIQMVDRDDFIWLAERPSDWRERSDDWPETRYENKALEGRASYLRFQRVAA